MTYNRMDKINILAALQMNDGNVLKTAKEFGVNRKSIYDWQRQLESDMKMLSQVETAVVNLAKIEELTALKASAELNKRLDNAPEDIRDNDLLKIKDSGISNSRLIRGEPTQIVQQQLGPEDHALEWLKILLTKTNGNLTEALVAFRASSLAPLVSDHTRDILASRVEADPKLLTE